MNRKPIQFRLQCAILVKTRDGGGGKRARGMGWGEVLACSEGAREMACLQRG